MIGKLRGVIESVEPTGLVVLEVGGVGYVVRVPQGALAQINSGQGVAVEISLFIHTAVREDAIDLYGFFTQEELIFFKQLMSVSGIGPKSALGVLDSADVMTLKRGIAKGDAASLTKVFGIGKKSAERIVVELRDKISLEKIAPSAFGKGSNVDGDVIEALMGLGYSAHESRVALKEIDDALTTTNERLAAALRSLGSAAKV